MATPQKANMDFWPIHSVPWLTPNNPGNSKRIPIHQDDASSLGMDCFQSHDSLLKEPQPSSTMPEMSWRPAYLRDRVLVAFCMVFIFILVTLEIMITFSTRNDGIASGTYGDHYLWTYGPTAILTAITALFSRVEYQSKMIAPWERISKHPTAASRSLLLDYVSQSQPCTIYRSLRNRDFTVSAATTAFLLLKIMTILSTGLMSPSLTGVNESEIPVVLQNAFVDDDMMLKSHWALPKYFMSAWMNDTGNYPLGITKDFAFQTFETSLPATAQIRVTVDGLTNSLACEPANLVLNDKARVATALSDTRTGEANISITSPTCKINGTVVFGPNAAKEDKLPYSPLFGHFSEVRCDGATDDAGNRVLVWFGQMEWFVDETILPYLTCRDRDCPSTRVRGRLLESAQLLCSPAYNISKVDVIKNGTEIQVIKHMQLLFETNPNPTLGRVTPWSIMRAHYDSFDDSFDGKSDGPYRQRESFDLGNGDIIDVDQYTRFLLESQFPVGAKASSLYDLSLLERLVQSYYRQFGAIIARLSLMQPHSANITGSALVMTNRVIVRSWSGHWMAGLAAVCLLLTALMILMSPFFEVLPCNPSSLSGVAVLISHSPDLLAKLRDAGDADEKCLARSLKSSKVQSGIVRHTISGQPQFTIQETTEIGLGEDTQPLQQYQSPHAHPGLLHPWTRMALCLTLLGVIAALEVILHQSKNKDGLGDVDNDTYIHYLWTSMPAIVLEGLVLMISSMEFNIRSLAPYIILNGMVNTNVFLHLELLDMSTPWAIYKQLRLRSLGALPTTMTLLIAPFFTIFSSSLFQATSLPRTSSIGLDMQNFFASDSLENWDSSQSGTASLLILEGNLSYPKFTYEDLVFPQLLPVPLEHGESMLNSSTLSTKTEIPAFRSRLTCRLYDSRSISTNIATVNTSSTGNNPLEITVEGETCDLYQYPDDTEGKYNAQLSIKKSASYFGIGSDLNGGARTCSDYFYAWGQLETYWANPPDVQHIAAIGCNETIEVVDVAVDFAGAGRDIDPQRPPSPLEATARNSSVSMNGSIPLYYQGPDLASRHMFDNSFALLTTSRFAITPEALGDPARDEEVAAALRFQHGIVAAQGLHANRAPPANVSAVDAVLVNRTGMVTATGHDVDSGPRYMYGATVTDAVGRRRVIQDAASTRVLEALLLAAVMLLLVGWATLPRTNVLPNRSPTTIAGAVALLAGGNLLEHLPEDAEWRGKEGVRTALGPGTRLWLGWGRMPDEEGIAMGNENENGVSRFGIFVVPPDEETSNSEASVEQRGET